MWCLIGHDKRSRLFLRCDGESWESFKLESEAVQFICSKHSDCLVENGLWVGPEAAAIVQMRRMVSLLDWSGAIAVGMVRNDLGHLELKPTGVAVVLRVVRERR